MKVIAYRDGRNGVVLKLPGEAPARELEGLLGGETKRVPLNDRLALVVRRDGEALGLPIRHSLHRMGHNLEPVYGDCAIVGVAVRGDLRDVSGQDVDAAECYIRGTG